MGVFTVIQLVYYAFRYGPTVFLLVKEIASFIKKLGGHEEQAEAAAALSAAIKHYGKTKDDRALRGLRRSLEVKCTGDDCPVS